MRRLVLGHPPKHSRSFSTPEVPISGSPRHNVPPSPVSCTASTIQVSRRRTRPTAHPLKFATAVVRSPALSVRIPFKLLGWRLKINFLLRRLRSLVWHLLLVGLMGFWGWDMIQSRSIIFLLLFTNLFNIRFNTRRLCPGADGYS